MKSNKDKLTHVLMEDNPSKISVTEPVFSFYITCAEITSWYTEMDFVGIIVLLVKFRERFLPADSLYCCLDCCLDAIRCFFLWIGSACHVSFSVFWNVTVGLLDNPWRKGRVHKNILSGCLSWLCLSSLLQTCGDVLVNCLKLEHSPKYSRVDWPPSLMFVVYMVCNWSAGKWVKWRSNFPMSGVPSLTQCDGWVACVFVCVHCL